MDRRHFLRAPAAAALGSLSLNVSTFASPFSIHNTHAILSNKRQGPRIVICGAGWAGMTSARYLRQLITNAEVILIEKNPTFWSGPMSNKWLIDIVNTDFINHDMLHAAIKYNYQLLHSEVTAVDRDKKRVHTAKGHIDYDYLILAGGIRNAYEAWFGNDYASAEYTRQHFPNAYIPNQEMLALKNKLHQFKGGTLVMTLPPPPHRCPPSPYERACLMAWYMKKNNIPGKIVILDPKPMIAPIGEGYRAAFNELYPDIITHIPNATVKELDPYKKHIKTTAGDFDFDDAVLMPPQQAADMVWQAGLIGTTADGKPTGWADIHPRFFTANEDDHIYVLGDAMGLISPQFGHYPKSAHVAHAVAKIVAQNLAQRVSGKEIIPVLPDNLCYMMVNADPQEEISVQFKYTLDPNGSVLQTQIDMDIRTNDLVKDDFNWITSRFNDFL